MKSLRLLLVEDSEDDALLLTITLRRSGYQCTYRRVDTADTLRTAIVEETWDAVICDYVMPQFSAPAALGVIKETGIDLPIIVVSGAMGEATAVEIMRAGAHDYLTKDNLARLVPAIEREMLEAANRRERHSAEKLSLQLGHILDNSSNEIFMFDASTQKIIQANRSAYKNIGYNADSLLSLTFHDLQPEMAVESFEKMLELLQSHEREEIVYQIRQRRADGSFYPAEVRLYLSQIEAPAVFVAVVEDVTERKRATDSVYFMVEATSVMSGTLQLDAIYDSVAKLAIPFLADLCIVDIVDEDGEFERVAVRSSHTDHAEKLDWIKDYIPDRTHPINRVVLDQTTCFIPELDEARLNQLPIDSAYVSKFMGSNINSYMAVPIMRRDQVIGVLSLIRTNGQIYQERDVQLAGELARRAAIAMENARLYTDAQQALMLRDQFLSIAAHELKTPITALLGNTQLLQRRLIRSGNEFSDREQRMLLVIEQQAQRLSRMVEALLDISRIRNGTLSLERESFDLNGLAERIIEEIQPTIERHTIYLKTVEGPINIVGDGLRLEQVFQNLIQNAIKYSPRGGRITVEIRLDQKKKEVVVSVSDQGIGIPTKALPNLFRQFFRADNTSSYQIGGMGLGLFVVREIIALHNGRVDVDSVEGKGSTFHVYLPYSESDQKVATANTDNDDAIATSTSANEVMGTSPGDFISAVNMATD